MQMIIRCKQHYLFIVQIIFWSCQWSSNRFKSLLLRSFLLQRKKNKIHTKYQQQKFKKQWKMLPSQLSHYNLVMNQWEIKTIICKIVSRRRWVNAVRERERVRRGKKIKTIGWNIKRSNVQSLFPNGVRRQTYVN